MLTRTITGALFISVVGAGVYFDQNIALILFAFIVLAMLDEFYRLGRKSGRVKPSGLIGCLTGVSLFVVLCLIVQGGINFRLLVIPILLLFLTFIIELFRERKSPFMNIAYTILGVFYITIPFSMLFHIGFFQGYDFTDDYSHQLILGFFILLWTNDTGAYLCGRYFGKHKLFERISPKKTWEGSIGGGILATVIAIILSSYFTNLDLINWLVVSFLISVFGGFGDLVESMLKRSFKVKDSGNILPGHGGILDRFDGLLLAAPFVYGYLQLIE